MTIVYLNGEFLPQEKATVSVMDRGFLFGDGVYEVIPIFDGTFFGFDKHIARLEKSLQALQIRNPLTTTEWKRILTELIQRNQKTTGNYNCYCQITRGADTTRKHTFPENLKPTVVAFITPSSSMSLSQLEKGFTAITLDDTRRRDCHVKAITLLPNILQMQEAHKKGALEAILIRNGEVLECTSSNLFVVKNNALYTPPLSPFILSGVTRSVVIQLANENHISCHEITITPEMLKNADEVWVTGSSKEICPIVTIDDQPIGAGRAGPLWKKMVAWYEIYKRSRDIHRISA